MSAASEMQRRGPLDCIRAVLEEHFYGHVAGERMHVLRSLFLLVLAFDIWLELAGHAARYGAGDFNLSHFALLDAVQPMPTPGLYLAVTFGAGLLSFVGAWLPQPRWVRAMLCAAYSYGWAMSLHDSYQHHYLISIVLFCFVFLPSAELTELRSDAEKAEEERPSGNERDAQTWAYPMLMTSVAVVYFYAAFAKLDPAWQSGDAFMRVAPAHAQRFFELGAEYKLSPATVLSLIGTSVVGIQVILGSVYLVAPWYERTVSKERLKMFLQGCVIGFLVVAILYYLRATRESAIGEYLLELEFVFIGAGLAAMTLGWPWTRGLALAAALSFHLGAEELGLKIGWFSYYMILIAVFCLGPSAISRKIYAFYQDVALTIAELQFRDRAVIATLLLLCFAGALALAAQIDLPGVTLGFAWAGLLLCADPLRRLAHDGRHAALTAAAIMVAGGLMWFSVTHSAVRFDYYRFLGGDLRRRGDLEGALDAYIRANRYAPDGEHRKEKEAQLRRALGR